MIEHVGQLGFPRAGEAPHISVSTLNDAINTAAGAHNDMLLGDPYSSPGEEADHWADATAEISLRRENPLRPTG